MEYKSDSAINAPVFAVLPSVARALKTGNDQLHLNYVQWDRHSKRGNYLFADGHSEAKTLEETLDPNNFLWGKKIYSDPTVTKIMANATDEIK